jgi:hypothetical protein
VKNPLLFEQDNPNAEHDLKQHCELEESKGGDSYGRYQEKRITF